MEITEKQIQLMHHALGADYFYKHKGFYRNYFAANILGDDSDEWEKLISLGLAFSDRLREKYAVYHVTEIGQKLIREKLRKNKQKISLSKARYQAYLEVGECYESFAHYLGIKR